MGVNFALLDDMHRTIFADKGEKCVFISHKKDDEAAAIAIGSYLTDTVGVNIYLDTQDCILQEAVSTENDRKIVESIQAGLICSTHLLCLISDKTQLSWWVPYEIGFADNENLNIAILKLKDVEDIPSFLKIKRTISNTEDFLWYASEMGPYGSLFTEKYYAHFSKCDNQVLSKYVD